MHLTSILYVAMTMATAVSSAELSITATHTPDGCDAARKSVKGDNLAMHYTGSIHESSETGTKGAVFDSSLKRGKPLEFVVGAGQVIKGWDQGLLDMCVGEKRTLIIPPELGYGSQGAGGSIPGGATLQFTVELMGFAEKKPQPNIFKDIDANQDAKISYDEMADWFRKQQPGKNDMNPIPHGLWEKEDANQDRFISWDEFTGPKGTEAPTVEAKEEL